jgi:hypothetical protein
VLLGNSTSKYDVVDFDGYVFAIADKKNKIIKFIQDYTADNSHSYNNHNVGRLFFAIGTPSGASQQEP